MYKQGNKYATEEEAVKAANIITFKEGPFKLEELPIYLETWTIKDWKNIFDSEMTDKGRATLWKLENRNVAPVIFEWMQWDEGVPILKHKQFDLSSLNIITLCKLLTVIIHSNHFCEGGLESNFENGDILRILKAMEKKVMQVTIKVELIKGDITEYKTDAIVNAANSSLKGGGGVDGAIHRKGGKQILEECKRIVAQHGKCNTGEAVYTNAGLLPSKYVIHTVGPVFRGNLDKQGEQLAACYINSLRIADELDVKSIAFPNISTGVYSFPKKEAAEIAINAVHDFLKHNVTSIEKVSFVCFDDENYKIYESNKLLSSYWHFDYAKNSQKQYIKYLR
jgi:O-acetyl-ADP-ribose deacetylase (regulator of RNase III)